MEDSASFTQVKDDIHQRIERTVSDYYFNECISDSLHTYKDTYIGAVLLQTNDYNVFVILLKHYPFQEVRGKTLFYHKEQKRFIDDVVDIKLYALYDYDNGFIVASGLKKGFNITAPEIELLDDDSDKTQEFRFTRLYHNGTFNEIHSSIIRVNGQSIDTISLEQIDPGPFQGEK